MPKDDLMEFLVGSEGWALVAAFTKIENELRRRRRSHRGADERQIFRRCVATHSRWSVQHGGE
jgi:hypothetical protein